MTAGKTTNQYNGLNEVTVTVDPIGNASTSSTVIAAHTTTNTYDSTGDLLTSTSPATEDWTSNPETSNYYNSNGTIVRFADCRRGRHRWRALKLLIDPRNDLHLRHPWRPDQGH